MVAVGLLAVRYAGSARWVLPGVFVLMTSIIICSLLANWRARAPLWLAAPLIGFFAVFHGFEHGARVPLSESAMRNSREIATAAAIFILSGMALGATIRHFANRHPHPRGRAVRA